VRAGKYKAMFRRATPEPIEELFTAHFAAIYRFAAGRVGQDAAVDIAAETFAQALRSVNRLDPARDARAWLFGIANNVIRHHRRAEQRRMRAYAAAAGQPDRRPNANGNAADQSTQRARLVEALVGLDVGDRETLLLLAWADLSYDEIAIALNVPLGTVRSRIHRARRVIRESLGSNDVVASAELATVAGEET
jgi:RNA polymerase sigma factor (sigma-70 family)